jgi:hypothetical protein
MHDSSSSQEIEIDYVTLHPPDSREIAIRRRVMEGIDHDVNQVFAAVPRRGAETGGILLGRREEGRIVVEDFEPVPSEHRFGPSYRLSETDRQFMQETLDWFRAGAQPGLSLLGFYRSHTLPAFALCEQDEEMMREHFSGAESFVLLIKPSRTGASVADFFVQRNGHPEEAFVPMAFPFTGTVVAAPPAAEPEESMFQKPGPEPLELPAVEPEPVPDVEPPRLSWPPPRPRIVQEHERPRQKRAWLWYTAAAALGLIGGALGYLSLHPETSAAPDAPQIARVPSHPAIAPAPPSLPAAASTQAAPAPAEPAEQDPLIVENAEPMGINGLLERWSTALKRGDAQTAAECYVPVVNAYYGRRDVPRDVVEQSIRQSLMRNGHLDIFRISDLEITRVGDGRAVATFRKHWQTSGYRKFAGEEQDRLALVRNQGRWQIASEQEQKLYWVHKPAR